MKARIQLRNAGRVSQAVCRQDGLIGGNRQSPSNSDSDSDSDSDCNSGFQSVLNSLTD
jgi:hypothetical protein